MRQMIVKSNYTYIYIANLHIHVSIQFIYPHHIVQRILISKTIRSGKP